MAYVLEINIFCDMRVGCYLSLLDNCETGFKIPGWVLLDGFIKSYFLGIGLKLSP